MTDEQQPALVTRLEFEAERAAVERQKRDIAALKAALLAAGAPVPPLESE